MITETISRSEARRLALIRAGLLKPEWTGLPRRAGGGGQRARDAALQIIERFGYLQLDTVAVAGARSHALVLLSRLENFEPQLGEALLQPGEPLFEYWGHEASWLPLDDYPLFGFRRRAYRRHPWWGDLIRQHPKVADKLRRRVQMEGALRSQDMEGRGSRGWWDLKIARKVASALWSAGEFAIRERRNFQRSFDLTERVIPGELLDAEVDESEALPRLLLRALAGHGWASTGTLAQTWRLTHCQPKIRLALETLRESGEILPCRLLDRDGRATAGWIRPVDLALAGRTGGLRPRRDRGVLLSPFDPVLWDRNRVRRLFGFEQVLEIFKPAAQRVYGYYCLPVLAGERLVARVDLKAQRKLGSLQVLATHYETDDDAQRVAPAHVNAVKSALERYAGALGLELYQVL